MTARRPAVLAAAAVLVAALTACTPAAGPTPSPTPTGFASEKEAFAAAEETYRAYIDALNDVDLADPATFEPVYASMAGKAGEEERRTLSGYHAEGWTVKGRSEVTKIEPIGWMPGSGTATLATCVDVSGVDVVDSSGQSMVDGTRPKVQSVLVTLKAEADASRLKIVSLEGRVGEPSC